MKNWLILPATLFSLSLHAQTAASLSVTVTSTNHVLTTQFQDFFSANSAALNSAVVVPAISVGSGSLSTNVVASALLTNVSAYAAGFTFNLTNQVHTNLPYRTLWLVGWTSSSTTTGSGQATCWWTNSDGIPRSRTIGCPSGVIQSQSLGLTIPLDPKATFSVISGATGTGTFNLQTNYVY